MGGWLNVGIEGHAIWPKNETSVGFGGHELILKPSTKDTDQSIHINLQGITDVEALTLINRFLSILSWSDGQGMENLYGWSGNPIPVAVPKKVRAIGSSIDFPFYKSLPEDPKTCLALALYREAQTVNSLPFAFLSYFKILNIFWKDKFQNKKNEIIEGLRGTLPNLEDQDVRERINKLSKVESDVAKYLYESGRCAIAHAYSDPIIDPDDVSHLRRLSEDKLIIQAVAEYLIENKLGVSRSIF